MSTVHDVAVVGYDTVDQRVAALPGQRGHSAVVVERHAHVYPMPPAAASAASTPVVVRPIFWVYAAPDLPGHLAVRAGQLHLRLPLTRALTPAHHTPGSAER